VRPLLPDPTGRNPANKAGQETSRAHEQAAHDRRGEAVSLTCLHCGARLSRPDLDDEYVTCRRCAAVNYLSVSPIDGPFIWNVIGWGAPK